MGNSTNQHDASIAAARADADARASAAASAAQASIAKANAQAKEADIAARREVDLANIAETARADKLAKEAERARAKEKAEAEMRETAHKQEMERLKKLEQDAKRAAEAAKQQRDIAHKQKMQEMEDQRKREEEEHRKQMRAKAIKAKQQEVANKEKQRDNAVAALEGCLNEVKDQIEKDETLKEAIKEDLDTKNEKLKNLNQTIKEWNPYKNDGEYHKAKDEMEAALKVFDDNDEQVWAAIQKTGQTEDGVGRFLQLAHKLIGQTMATQSNADVLDAELNTFSTLISRECQDKLTIEYYFEEQNLKHLVPILAKQNYIECQGLICEDKDEYKEDILDFVNEEIDKQIEEWKKMHPEEVDQFEAWLDNYKLAKYKKVLEDAEVDSFETVVDAEMLDEETIEEIIEEAEMKKLAAKKFKKAVKEAQSGKYKPAEPENDDNKDEEKSDPWDIFLEKYQLQKYKESLKEAGLDGFDAIKDLKSDQNKQEPDSEIANIIKQAGITGLFEKKFKRAINDYKTGKYKPAEQEDEKKDEPKPAKLGKGDERKLRDICLKPDTWKDLEIEKRDLTKKALVGMTPVFGAFFMKMNQVIKRSQKLLDYSDETNEEQAEAMTAMMQSVKPKAIEAPNSNDDDSNAPDEDELEMKDENVTAEEDEEKSPEKEVDPKKLPEYTQRKQWEEATEVQVYSKEKDRWYDGTIKKITNDDEGEWLTIEYKTDKDVRTKQVDRYGEDVRDPLMVKSRAIYAAISVDISNVIEVMMPRFELNETTLRVLPMAYGIEQSTKAIVLAQSQIRQSVKLAANILNLKPAKFPTEESKQLWKAVDDGIIHIIKGALQMNKISAVYFGYFLRFNQSFQRFISMNKENKDVSLFNSLEYIKQDIKEFSAFKKEFSAQVEELGKQAMLIISNCVEQCIGAKQYKERREAREKSLKDYQQKLANFMEQKIRLDNALEKLKNDAADKTGEVGGLDIQIKQLTQRLVDNKNFRDEWIKEISDLRAQNFDAGDAFNKLVEAEAANIKQ